MKNKKSNIVLCLALVLCDGLFGCSTNVHRSIESRQPAPVINGLQMSLSVSMIDNRDNPEFEVAIRNAMEKDVTLNLGVMLANGNLQLPDKIHLTLRDRNGTIRKLLFSDPAIAGRVDDYTVPLRAGSTYILKLRLDQFWSPGTQEFALKLKAGRYEISAQFQGDEPEHFNMEMEGMKSMNFWKGKLQSNVVVIKGKS
jgi:hypothetical protein